MADSASVNLEVVTAPFRAGLDAAWSLFRSFGSKIKQTLSTAFTVFSEQMPLWLADFGTGLREGFAGLKDGETSLARIENLLRATGGVAGKTKQDIYDMSKALQDLTTVNAGEAESAMAVLLQFKNVRGDIFDRAVKGAADFAATTGDSLPMAMEKLGRAIDDPIRGLTRLRMEGVRFSAQEEQMIKQMIYSGDVVKAQTMILDRMASTFGGAAGAQLNTFSGKITQINNLLEDMWEAIAKSLVPVFELFLPYIKESTLQATAAAEAFGQWMVSVGEWAKQTLPVIEDWLNKLKQGALDAAKWVAEKMLEGFTAVQTIIQDLPQTWETTTAQLKYWWSSVTMDISTAWEKVTVTIENLWYKMIDRIQDAWGEFQDFSAQVIARIPGVAAALGVDQERLIETLSENQKIMKDLKERSRASRQERVAGGPSTAELDALERLRQEAEKAGSAFGDRFTENLGRNRATVKQFIDETMKKLNLSGGPQIDEKAARDRRAAMSAPYTFDKEESTGGSQGGFEALEALQKRIQSASFKSPELAQMQQQTQLTREMLHEMRQARGLARQARVEEAREQLAIKKAIEDQERAARAA